jgi:hypothetical protein
VAGSAGLASCALKEGFKRISLHFMWFHSSIQSTAILMVSYHDFPCLIFNYFLLVESCRTDLVFPVLFLYFSVCDAGVTLL